MSIELKEKQVIVCTHTCENTPPAMTREVKVEAQENGRIPWPAFCKGCGMKLPEYISVEAAEANQMTWLPCDCGAVVHRDNDFVCTNPPCKFFGQARTSDYQEMSASLVDLDKPTRKTFLD